MIPGAASTPTSTTSVRRRILHGLGANAYGQLVTVIVQLAGVPVLLHAWGTQLYGEWLILFAIPAYLSMVDLGFSQSAGNDMTARVARDDRAGALSVFQSLGVLVYGLTAIGLTLSALVVFQPPIQEWLNFQALDADSTRWTLWLLSATVLVTLPDGVTHAGFRAGREYALHYGMHSTVRLLQFAGVWVVALAGGGPVTAAAAFFVIRAAGTLIFAVMVVRRHPWLRYGFNQAEVAELRRLLSPALANTAVPLAQAVNIQGMVLVVGVVLGPLAVVVFSTLRTLTRLAMQMVLVVARTAEPELAAANGATDQMLMRNLFIHSLRGSFWLALAAVGGLAVFGSFILDVWTHGKIEMHSPLFGWLLCSAVTSALWYCPLFLLRSTNQHLSAASLFVVMSIASVGVAVPLLSWTKNLATAGFSLFLADAVLAFYTLSTASRLLDTKSTLIVARAVNPYPLVRLAAGMLQNFRIT